MAICPKCEYRSDHLGERCPKCDGDEYLIYDDALSQAASDSILGRPIADKYVPLRQIEEGGMGTVYEGIQLLVERPVAIKVLRTDLSDSEDYQSRFLREAKSVSRVQHPHIITLYDFGFEPSGNPYMVMEYAPGPNLIEWLRTQTPGLEDVLQVYKQILSALSEAHKSGIVHRDLKPENIILLKAGRSDQFVKVLDFGIAKALNNQAETRITKEGEVVGTPYYMAPEQCRGELDIGPEADVYAISILLYELITGQLPFAGEKPLEVAMQHVDEPLPSIQPRSEIGEIPNALDDIIKKGAVKRQSDRFEDATEMLEALKGALFRDPSFSLNSYPSLQTTTANQMPETATLQDVSVTSTKDQFNLTDHSEADAVDENQSRDRHNPATLDTIWDTVRPTLRKTRSYLSQHTNLAVAIGLLFIGLFLGSIFELPISSSQEAKKPKVKKEAKTTSKPDEGEPNKKTQKTVKPAIHQSRRKIARGMTQARREATQKAEKRKAKKTKRKIRTH